MTAVAYNYWIDTQAYQPVQSVYNVFSREECAQIIEIGSGKEHSTGLVPGVVSVSGNKRDIDTEIRRSYISWILSNDESNSWIYKKIIDAVREANKHYGFELQQIENVQFTRYDATGEFYGKHIDMLYQSTHTRKLSITIQLSDPQSYAGGDLALYTGSDIVYGDREQGTANFFPSYVLHEVTPVVKGTRYSLVAWMTGPRFK